MKKTLIAILCLSASVTATMAAQITWRQNTTPFKTGDAILSGSQVLLLLSDSSSPTVTWDGGTLKFSDGVTYLGQSALAESGILANVILTLTGDWSEGSLAVAGGAAYGQSASVDAATIGYGGDAAHDYYMVIFDSATISSDSKYTIADLAGKKISGKTSSLTLSFPGSDLKDATWSPVSVPEPTAVALLALGLAAVGLKRKVA